MEIAFIILLTIFAATMFVAALIFKLFVEEFIDYRRLGKLIAKVYKNKD